MVVVTESQMRQALEIVVRELAGAIVQALPQHPQPSQPTSQMGTALGEVLPDGRLLLTVAEAAAMLSINRSTLYRMLLEGQIRTIRIGRLRRVPVSALQEFVTRQVQDSM